MLKINKIENKKLLSVVNQCLSTYNRLYIYRDLQIDVINLFSVAIKQIQYLNKNLWEFYPKKQRFIGDNKIMDDEKIFISDTTNLVDEIYDYFSVIQNYFVQKLIYYKYCWGI